MTNSLVTTPVRAGTQPRAPLRRTVDQRGKKAV